MNLNKWSDILGTITNVSLWVLLGFNMLIDKYDIALVYGIIIIAFALSDIANNTRKQKDET